MYSVYLALLIFVLFALAVPFAMIFSSIMIRNRKRSNRVRNASFESAEASSGSRISIMNEYMHYFSIFVAFDIIVAIMLIWAYTAYLLTNTVNMIALMLPVAGFIMVVITLAMLKFTK
jgi:NADH:ubiquinone oxidoreductase subunit 3 (subunit A)